MQYKVKKELRPVYIIASVTGFMSILFVYVGVAGIGNLAVNQVIMLVFGAICMYTVIRYALTDYVYVISESAPHKIEIVKISGQLPKTMAVIDVCPSHRILPLEKGKKIPESIEKISKKENFCSNIFPKQTYLYVFEYGGEKCACKLEMEEEVAILIRNIIENSKNID